MTDEDILRALASNMSKRRTELKLTQKEVAARADMAESTYKKCEGGSKNMPTLDTLMKIARGLQTDLNSLIPQEHMSEDPAVWQVERKLMSLKKGKRKKVAEAVLVLINTLMSND